MNPSVFPQGYQFGPYVIESLLGQGGMGQVYLAVDPHIGRQVAVKIVSDIENHGSDTLERFKREGRLLASLNHPNITTMHSVGCEQGMHYICMEFVDGLPLDEYLQKRVFSIKEYLSLCKQILSGLQAAHQQQVLHRDLKPNNVLIRKDGFAKLADFGIAKSFMDDSNLTRNSEFFCTVNYLAPEIALGGRFSIQSDIYSAGIIFYEVLVGQCPFVGRNSVHTIELIKNQKLVFPSSISEIVPERLLRIITKMTEKAPLDRYHTTQEVLDDFDNIKIEEFPENLFKTRQIKSSLSADIVKRRIEERGYSNLEANIIFEILAERLGEERAAATTASLDEDVEVNISDMQIQQAILSFEKIKKDSTVTIRKNRKKSLRFWLIGASAVVIAVLALFLGAGKISQVPMTKAAEEAPEFGKFPPDPQPGDKYSFLDTSAIVDLSDPRKPKQNERTVTKIITVDSIQGENVKWTLDDGSWFIARNASFQTVVESSRKKGKTTVIGNLARLFPLAIGKKASVEQINSKGRIVKNCEVTGKEYVSVPAGDFDTFVIECTMKNASIDFTDIFYYAPEIEIIAIKKSKRIRVGSHRMMESSGILQAYSLMPRKRRLASVPGED